MIIENMEIRRQGLPLVPGNRPAYLRLPDIRIIWQSSPFERKELLLEAGACRLIFCLDGTLKVCGCIPKEDFPLRIRSGSCGFIFHPLGCTYRACESDDGARAMMISFSYEDILQLLGREEPSCSLWQARQKKHPLGIVIQTSPAMKHLLRLMEPQAGDQGAGNLFVAAKAVELLWLFVENYAHTSRQRIADTDRRAVHRAQAILEQKMADPPSLSQLASHVGMSSSKLKKIFPDICGLPPYGYLRRMRMERALALLRTNGMSVTETAYEVGYNSLSQFSKAFAEHFGFRPSDARKL